VRTLWVSPHCWPDYVLRAFGLMTKSQGGQSVALYEGAMALVERCPELVLDIYARFEEGERIEQNLHPRIRIFRLPLGPTDRYLPKERFWGYPIEDFVQSICRFTDERGLTYDIIHGHYADGWSVARKLSERWRIPFVCSTHSLGKRKLQNAYKKQEGTPAELEMKYSFSNRIREECLAISRASCICPLTHEEAAFLVENYRATPERIRVVPNGVRVEDYYPAHAETGMVVRRELGIGEREFVVLNVGRVDERKGHRELIETIPEVLELANSPATRIRFVFVGWTKNRLADELEQRIDYLNLNNYVTLISPVSHDGMAKYYWASNVYTVPSSYDVMPLAMLEAMAAGLPVVATRNGGPREVIKSGVNGIVVDTTDPHAFALALAQVIRDRVLAYELGVAARKTVSRRYGWTSTAEEFLSIYHELIGIAQGVER